MSSIKRIEVSDAMDIARDERVNQSVDGIPLTGLTGIVTMREPASGRVVFQQRKNLIVLRGRTFALEKLFDDTIGSAGVNTGVTAYQSDLNRKVMAFGVGRGGAPASDPFAPYAPPPTGANGLGLAAPVPFRLHNTSQSASADPLLFIPAGEIGNYGGAAVVSGTTNQFNYYLKHFDNRDPSWFFDENANTVYKEILLSITGDDCRTGTSNYINELALFFSRAGSSDARGGATFTTPEMFSRITFPTEFLSSTKVLQIVYRIYA